MKIKVKLIILPTPTPFFFINPFALTFVNYHANKIVCFKPWPKSYYSRNYTMDKPQTKWPLLSEVPPNVPAALGTLLYPKNADKLTPGRPCEDEMNTISSARQQHEANIQLHRKDSRWERIRMNNSTRSGPTGKPYCSICSESTSTAFPFQKCFYHKHVSSKEFRLRAKLDHYGQYPCFTCAVSPHLCKSGVRYPIILTASALNEWHRFQETNLYAGDEIHVDSIAIPGAKLDTLLHALTIEYGGLNRPIDVLVVAGVNDILQNTPLPDIARKFLNISSWVRDQKKYHPDQENTCVFATIPYIPKVCRLDGDRRAALPDDKLSYIVNLNEMIRGWNKDNSSHLRTSAAPQFHTWGIEIVHDTKYNDLGTGHNAPHPTRQTVKRHRWNSWREKRIQDKVHLNKRLTFKMGRSAVRYFLTLYHIIELVYEGKKEAELASRAEQEERVTAELLGELPNQSEQYEGKKDAELVSRAEQEVRAMAELLGDLPNQSEQ